MSRLGITGAVVVVIVAGVVAASLPDLARYMRIRRM